MHELLIADLQNLFRKHNIGVEAFATRFNEIKDTLSNLEQVAQLSNIDNDALSVILRHSNDADISSLSQAQKKWSTLGRPKLQGCLKGHVSSALQELGDERCGRRWDYNPDTIKRAVACCLDMRARPIAEINPPRPSLHLYVHVTQLGQFNANAVVKCLAETGFPPELTLLYPPPRKDIPNTLPEAAGVAPHRALVVADASEAGLADGTPSDVDTVRFSGECTEIQEEAFKFSLLIELPPQMPQLQKIGKRAFMYCAKLQSMPETLPALETIGDAAFIDCGELMRLPETLPALQKIGKRAFMHCAKLQSIPKTLPKLETIGDDAFRGCEELTRLPETLPALQKIGERAFFNCKNLQSMPETLEVLEEIGDNAFQRCEKLRMLPKMPTLKKIGRSAFVDCDELHTLPEMPELISIENYAFFRCENLLTQLGDMENLTTIGIEAFAGTRLAKLGNTPSLTKIDNEAFIRTPLTQLGELSSLKTIGTRAFAGTRLAKLGNTPSLTNIGNEAFFRTPLTQLGELSSLKTIGTRAFAGTRLAKLGDMRALTDIRAAAFADTPLKQLGDMENLTTIGVEAFSRCHLLNTLHLPKTLKSVENNAFEGCPLGEITVEPGADFECHCDHLADNLSRLEGIQVNRFRIKYPRPSEGVAR